MLADDLLPLPAPVEIARVRAIDVALARTEALDATGSLIEVHSCAPTDLPQLEKALSFVQQRLLSLSLGEGDALFQLRKDELVLDYMQLPTKRDGGTNVGVGYRLTLCAYASTPDSRDIEKLRMCAHKWATTLLRGNAAEPDETENIKLESENDAMSFLPRDDPGVVAKKIHGELKGKRVKYPFLFTNSCDAAIEFAGSFAGDREANREEDPLQVRGYINSVTYRGLTLSFELEVEASGFNQASIEKLIIEFSPLHLDAVHRLAGDPLSLVQVRSEVRTTRHQNGRKTTTYTLASIESFQDLDMSGWQEDDRSLLDFVE